MSDGAPSDDERRNLSRVDEWAAAWAIPGGSSEELVDRLYADAPEVHAPLQATVFLKKGDSKARLLAFEQAGAKPIRERKMVFHQKIASGDSVAVEVEVPYTLNDGSSGTDWFAAFLTFDAEGRIVEDHTFMRDRPFSPGNK